MRPPARSPPPASPCPRAPRSSPRRTSPFLPMPDIAMSKPLRRARTFTGPLPPPSGRSLPNWPAKTRSTSTTRAAKAPTSRPIWSPSTAPFTPVRATRGSMSWTRTAPSTTNFWALPPRTPKASTYCAKATSTSPRPCRPRSTFSKRNWPISALPATRPPARAGRPNCASSKAKRPALPASPHRNTPLATSRRARAISTCAPIRCSARPAAASSHPVTP